MEHIVQFAISMDDDRIKKSIEANAETVIMADLRKSVVKTFFDAEFDNYRNEPRYIRGLSTLMDGYVTKFIEQNKDKIIEKAAEKLAEKMSRTKAVKEATLNVLK